MKKWIQRFKENERGLTLVELLAVIVILAIVGLIAFVAIGNVIDNSKKDAHIANAIQAISAAELYEASGSNITKHSDYSTTTGLSAKKLDTVGDLVNPWNAEDANYDLSLIKTGDEITVSSDLNECSFSGKTKAQLNSQERDTICTDGR